MISLLSRAPSAHPLMAIHESIEALLLYRNEPLSRTELARLLSVSKNEIDEGIETLKEKWTGGVALVDTGESVSLMTSSSQSPLIEKIRKEEMETELGKAALETLTIVLYKGPVSRREIDFIRGVQSQYILRSLASRGLIERIERGNEGYVYQATHELLGILGVKGVKDLPEYGTLTAELEERMAGINTQEQ